MASTFDTAWATAAGSIMATFADTLAEDVYTPAGGVARNIRGYLVSEGPSRDGRAVEAKEKLLYTALISATSGLPAEPNYGGDTLYVKSLNKTFRLFKSPEHDAGDKSLIVVELR